MKKLKIYLLRMMMFVALLALGIGFVTLLWWGNPIELFKESWGFRLCVIVVVFSAATLSFYDEDSKIS